MVMRSASLGLEPVLVLASVVVAQPAVEARPRLLRGGLVQVDVVDLTRARAQDRQSVRLADTHLVRERNV